MEDLLGLPKAIPIGFAKGNLRLVRRVNIFWGFFVEIVMQIKLASCSINLRLPRQYHDFFACQKIFMKYRVNRRWRPSSFWKPPGGEKDG